MDTVTRALRLAFRSLFRNPGLTAAAVLTMSLGVGASTAMFTLLDRVVIRPLPYPDAGRIVRLFTSEIKRADRRSFSGANFVDFCARSSSYEAISGYRGLDFSARGGEFPVSIHGTSVTPGFFQVFGVQPLVGRVFSPASDQPGGERVVVISYALWSSRFAEDPGVIGEPLELNGESYTVVGVMPRGFDFPEGTQLWAASRFRSPEPPVPLGDDPAENRGAGYLSVVARLAPGVAPSRAGQEAAAIGAQLAAEFPDNNRGETIVVASLHEVVVGPVRPMLVALFAAVGLVLLIGCANVANLLLARASGRAHEVAIRSALGASRGHVVRQLLVESTVLGVLGGAGGTLLAFLATRALVGVAASGLPRADEVTVDVQVLVFALAVSVFSGLLFGLVPAVWLAGRDTSAALRNAGGRGLTGGAHGRLRSALVVAEVAVCLPLLVGAGLLARSLAMLGAQDPGFSERGTLTARVRLPGARIPDNEAIASFQSAVLERVRALPGVTSAGAVMSLPIDPGLRATLTLHVEGYTPREGEEPACGYQVASDGYFRTIGIPVIRGRAFTASDSAGAARVAVVSEAFVRRFLPHEDPIGKRIGWGGDPASKNFQWSTIVGVVGSTRLNGLDDEFRIEAYQPMAQDPWPSMTLVIRTKVPPESLSGPLRRAISEVSPIQPVEKIETMEQILHDSLARRRFAMLVLWVFAGIALALAAVGLYGVTSFSVAQRTPEFGVRIAVGAGPRHIYSLVFRGTRRVLLGGLLAGAAATLVLGRLAASLLFKVRPTDFVAFSVAVAILAAATALAAWLPARRATRTDPIVVLRAE